jgi:hypothetical protein
MPVESLVMGKWEILSPCALADRQVVGGGAEGLAGNGPARRRGKSAHRSANPKTQKEGLMPRFLFIYRSEPFDMSKMSPEQMQESMDRWRTWIGQGFAEGWMVDPGDALMPEGRIVTASKVVTDGPFAESKEVVGGFSVIQAASIDEAVTYARICPNVTEGGRVEIRPMAGIGGETKG